MLVMSENPVVQWLSTAANVVTIVGISGLWWAYKARYYATLEEQIKIERKAVNDWVDFTITLRFNAAHPIVGIRAYGIGDRIKLEKVVDQNGEPPTAIEPTAGSLHIRGKLHRTRPELQYVMVEYSLAGRPLRDQRAELIPVEFEDLGIDKIPLLQETRVSRLLAPYRRQRTRKFRKIRVRSYPSQHTHEVKAKTSQRAVEVSFQKRDGK